MKRKLCFGISIFFLITAQVFSQTMTIPTTAVASRTVDGDILYYDTLQEAFNASALLPDEITLLLDVEINAPLIIGDNINIRLVAGGGDRTIIRSDDFIEYPIIWITGENASLTLGKPDMNFELIIDGGCYQPILSHSPLIVLNGLDSKLIMYDNVILQNNHNTGVVLGEASFYKHGAGVLVRTYRDNFQRSAEFIMKGGIIRGNENRTIHPQPFGGGVSVIAGIFTMEGGSIMDNTVLRTGGGVFISSMSSFNKTGGIIYGQNAPEGYRNTAINYNKSGFFAHAVSVGEMDYSVFRFRNDTVNENEVLTYKASATGEGIFGKGEKWHDRHTLLRRNLFIFVPAIFAVGILVFLFLRKKLVKKDVVNNAKSQALVEAESLLTDREKEIFYLLLSGKTARNIAQDLKRSISSINTHTEKIYRKLNVQSKTELLVKFK